MMWLLEWWNFVFVAPLIAGIVFAVALVLSGLGADHASDGDDGDADEGAFDLLGWFGIGRGVSLTVMLPVLLIAWGITGLMLNALLQPILRLPVLYAPIALLGAIYGMGLAGRSLAKAFVRLTDANRVTSVKAGGLVGCVGSSVFEITVTGGAANIRDPFGNIHRISVRSSSGVIPANASVTVLEFHKGLYVVQVSDGVDARDLKPKF